jgi:hypothetical protein
MSAPIDETKNVAGSAAGTPARIPFWVKLVYTAFVAVLVPYYWHSYGPTNFLYFCDMALLLTLVALWRESSLLVSMCAVGILMPQTLWIIDFLCEAAGVSLTGMTGYMFNPNLSLVTRGLSFFHFWLPLFLVWLLWRLGYDKRALLRWSVLAWALMFVCFFLMPPPPAPADKPNMPVNINYVYGLSEQHPQQWMPEWQYFTLMLTALPLVMFLPTHLALRKLCATGPRPK